MWSLLLRNAKPQFEQLEVNHVGFYKGPPSLRNSDHSGECIWTNQHRQLRLRRRTRRVQQLGLHYQGAVLTCDYPVTQNFNASVGFGWMLGSIIALSGSPSNEGAGISGPNSAIEPPSFDGMPFSQAAVLQGIGSFAGRRWRLYYRSYTLSFYLGGRLYYPPRGFRR